jgi:exosome complex component RRP4
MGKLLVKEKEVVVPGEEIADGMDYLPTNGTYRDGEKIIASQIGIVRLDNRLIKLTPLSGVYNPRRNDTIIGLVKDITFNGWLIDFDYANLGMISLKDGVSDFVERGADLTQYYTYGDVVVAKILNITKSKSIDLGMKGPGLMKLKGGRLITVSPVKVPRIIGKQGSMISMIKDATGCRIIVGQNGKCWVNGTDSEKENLAVKAIMKIDKEAHVEGLTDIMEKFLKGK